MGISRTKDIVADPETTTPSNCTCISICRCGQEDSDCDPGNPISWWPTSSTVLGEIRDSCNTGYVYSEYLWRDEVLNERTKMNETVSHLS